MIKLIRRKRSRRPKTILLEAAVTARIAATKLTMLMKRIHRLSSRDPSAAKLLRKLASLQLALEAVSLRLETLAVTGVTSVEELSAIREAVRMLTKEYSTVLPGIVSTLHELEASVTEAAAAANIELESASTASVGEAAARIIEEAEKVAEERLRTLLGGGVESYEAKSDGSR